jgi:hypothetical protein
MADLVIKNLMGMTVDVRYSFEGFENLHSLLPISDPEVPRWIVFIQGGMGKDYDRSLFRNSR